MDLETLVEYGGESIEEETALIINTIDEIAEDYDHEYWRKCSERDEIGEELWAALAEHGFAGINIPEEYGGTDLTLYQTAMLVDRLTSHGVFEPNIVGTAAMAPIPLRYHANQKLKNKFLPKIAQGEITFCFAITEPHSGTNSYRIRTQARREGDEYVINGEKTYITIAEEADYMMLMARTTPYEAVKNDDPSKGITLLILPTDEEGIETNSMDLEIVSAENNYQVYFDDVRVPVSNRIGDEGQGFKVLFDSLVPERVCVGAMAVGFGTFALGCGVEYAKEREVWGEPIGSHQGVQHPLSRSKIELEQARLLTYKAAEYFDDDNANAGMYANMAKYSASEAGNQAAERAIKIHGGAGFSRDYKVINVRNYLTHLCVSPINNEMVLNHIGEKGLGLPKSY
jgi:acyl-CoA dehydrogenase